MTTLIGTKPNQETNLPRGPGALRVAYIMSRFPKLTETFVLNEIRELSDQGHEVEIWPLQRERTDVMHRAARRFVDEAHFTPWLSHKYLWSHARFFLKSPWVYLGILWTLLRANWGSRRFLVGAVAYFPKAVYLADQFERRGIRHVHAHFASHPAMAAWVIHKLTGISYSFTAHGSDLHRDQHMLIDKVESASAVIAISQDNRRMIQNLCGEDFAERVRVVHCGVDAAQFSRRKPRRETDAPFSILCIGTLHEVKGQSYLLKACRILMEEGRDFVCHFIGDGEDLSLLERLARPLEGRVRFHGRKTAGEIRELLQNADVLVAPSVPTASGRREGIPVVLMEALNSGVAVIASELSGIPELVRHEQTGLLAPPRDSIALASAIRRLMDDPDLRERLADEGHELVRREFDLKINANTLAGIFQECVGASC